MWHLVRHDLASLRPFLGAWLAVLTVQSLVLRMGPPIPDGTIGPAMSLDIAAVVMRLALTVVFVSALVSHHPVVGTTAFWRTRPIQRPDLFGSTIVTLGLVLVLAPFVWTVTTFVWLGFEPAHAAQAALAMSVEQALFAMLALVLAAMTRNLAQAVVTALAVAAVYVLGRQAAMALPYHPLPVGLVMRQGVLAALWPMLAASLALLLLAAHQYLTLRTRRSHVLVAAALVVVVLASRFPLVRPAGRDLPVAPISLETPEVNLDRSSIRTGNVTRMSDTGTRAHVSQSALFEDPHNMNGAAVILRPMAVQSRLLFSDGFTERFDSGLVTPWVDGGPEAGPARQPWTSMSLALGGVDVIEPRETPSERFRSTFLEVAPDTYRTRATQPATLGINVTFEAYRYEGQVRLPLTLGARAYGPAYVLEFEGTAPDDQGVAVLVRETSAPGAGDPAPPFYALLNTSRRQAVITSTVLSERFRSSLTFSAAPIIARHRVTFSADRSRVTIDAAWMAGAELLVLRARSLGRVIRGVHVAGYTLVPPHETTPLAPQASSDPAR